MLTIDPTEIQTKYLTKKDSKKRVTAESEFDHFEVAVLKDGTLVFSPRVLVDPNTLSTEIAAQIRDGLLRMSHGEAGTPVDIDAGEQALMEFRTLRKKKEEEKKDLHDKG